MGQVIKEEKSRVYLLLKSEMIQVNGIRHAIRAWRVEKPTKLAKEIHYEFICFKLTHSDNKGAMLFEKEFHSLDILSREMVTIIKDLNLTFQPFSV